jgi:hypothetical protein
MPACTPAHVVHIRRSLRGTGLALRKPTCVTNAAEVPADALVLRCGHLDGGCVVCVRDAQVFTVDVHELDLKVTDAVLI